MNIRIKRSYASRKHRPRLYSNRNQARLLAYLVLLGFIIGALLYIVESRNEQKFHEVHEGVGTFDVIDGLEVHEEVAGAYKIDALLPQVVSDLKDATNVGAEIAADFYYIYDRNQTNVAEAFSGWKSPVIEVSYEVKRKNKIHEIIIATNVSSIYAYEPLTIVRHYYYNEKKQKVLESKIEYKK